jgi:hypothetical protein
LRELLLLEFDELLSLEFEEELELELSELFDDELELELWERPPRQTSRDNSNRTALVPIRRS